MQDKILSRIEELSNKISNLISDRERCLQELNSISAEIETQSAVIFELKSLLDSVEEEQY
jgi:GTP cyclohydrolase II